MRILARRDVVTNAKWLQKSSILHFFKVPQCLQTPGDPPKCRFVGSACDFETRLYLDVVKFHFASNLR